MSDPRKRPVYCVYHNDGHPALALGMIGSFAQRYNGGVLCEAYEFTPGVLRSMDGARAAVAARGPGILLCSSYIWNYRENLEIARAIAEEHPTSFAIFGGPSVPKYDESCRRFLACHPFIDVTVRGEGEMTTAE